MPEAIDSASAYAATLRLISQQQGSPSLLHTLMNRLEEYRQKRKMGWSRPWNKYGVTTFLSFRLSPADIAWLNAGVELVAACQAPDEVLAFTHELQHDPAWMGFIFYAEVMQDGHLFEAVTLSLGRRAEANPRQRDRLDLRWDIPLQADVDGVGPMFHIWVDPLREEDTAPLWQLTEHGLPEAGKALFGQLAEVSWQWHDQPERLWTHWTSRYIDYFGERRYRPAQCCFYLAGAQPAWSAWI